MRKIQCIKIKSFLCENNQIYTVDSSSSQYQSGEIRSLSRQKGNGSAALGETVKKLKIFSELNFSFRVIFVVTLFTFICYTFFSAAHCFSKNKIYAGMYLLAGKCRNIIQIIPLPNHPNRIIVRSIPNEA